MKRLFKKETKEMLTSINTFVVYALFEIVPFIVAIEETRRAIKFGNTLAIGANVLILVLIIAIYMIADFSVFSSLLEDKRKKARRK